METNMQTVYSGLNEDISQISWEKLGNLRIYFAHQSVGNNIIAGVESISKDNPGIKLNVKRIDENMSFSKPVFSHSQVGRNGYPELKIQKFEEILDSGIGDSVDIAFLKLCYADIHNDTDVENIFNLYKFTLSRLEKKYPNIIFFHITVPLQVKGKGIKGILKIMSGKDHNCQRCRYNELLKKEYNIESIFDIAGIESTYHDGSREVDSKACYALIPDYTNDGSHLNEIGQKIVAKSLLNFILKISE